MAADFECINLTVKFQYWSHMCEHTGMFVCVCVCVCTFCNDTRRNQKNLVVVLKELKNSLCMCRTQDTMRRQKHRLLPTWYININRDDAITPPDDRVRVMVVTAAVSTAAHGDDPARLRHLVIHLHTRTIITIIVVIIIAHHFVGIWIFWQQLAVTTLGSGWNEVGVGRAKRVLLLILLKSHRPLFEVSVQSTEILNWH